MEREHNPLSAAFADASTAERLQAGQPALYAAADGFWSRCLTPAALTPRLTELILVALHASATATNASAIARHVRRAQEAGASDVELHEVLLSIVGLANHSLYWAIPIYLDEFREKDGGSEVVLPELTEELAAIKADFIRTRGFWNGNRDAIARCLPDYFAALSELSVAPWKSGALSPKERELIYIAIDSSVTHMYEPGLRIHLKAALDNGASREEILEVLKLVAVFGMEGYILGVEAIHAAGETSR